MSWIGVNGADAITVTGDWNETEDAGETTNWSNHSIGDILPNPNEPYQPITTMRSAGLTDPSPASIAGNHDTIDSTTPDARFDYAMYAKLAFLNGEVFDTKQLHGCAAGGVECSERDEFCRERFRECVGSSAGAGAFSCWLCPNHNKDRA